MKENEEVEFEICPNGGKTKAINVTGPGGAYVQGAPRRNMRCEITYCCHRFSQYAYDFALDGEEFGIALLTLVMLWAANRGPRGGGKKNDKEGGAGDAPQA